MFHPRKLASALAFALSCAGVAHAGSAPFDNVVVFGDSLSDNGNFSSKLFPTGPTMRFTTNPGEVAVELVAQHYGFTLAPSSSGGSDYAWGGALAGTDTSEFGIPIPSTQHQLNDYFAQTGGHADSHTLYTFWIGANDLFGAIDSGSPNATATATATAAAQSALNGIGRLLNAGARYIVVFNIPDLSKTPSYNTSPQAANAGALTVVYNDELNAGLTQLGVGIIPVNAYGLLNQVIADPARYGFTDVTHEACNSFSSILCSPANLVTPDAASTYLFADGVHPTTASHTMLSQVVLSELQAPQQISLLPEAPLAAANAYNSSLGMQMIKDSLGEGTRAFVNIGYAQQRFDATPSSPALSSNNASFTLGYDWTASDTLSAGAAFGFGHDTAHMNGGGGYRMSDYSALGFVTYHAGSGYVSGYGHLGRSNFSNVERSFQVGAASVDETGDTDGSHYGLGVKGGWWFNFDRIKTGPFAGLDWQDITVDSYHERGSDATAMWFGRQHRQALVGSLGWRLQGQWQVANLVMAPYAELAWNRDSKADATREVTAGLNTMNGSFAISGFTPDKAWGEIALGLSAELTPNVTSWIGYEGRFSDTSQRNNSFNMGFRIKF